MKPRTHVWNRLRSQEIIEAQRAGAVVLIPLGATEQHGRHLAAHTDILIARQVCLKVAAAAENPVLVADVLSVGFSPEHMAVPSAISLRLETFTTIVADVVRSIWRHGFHRIVVVNGHGGNMRPLRALALDLTRERIELGVCTYWETLLSEQADLLKGPVKYVRHAGEFETSLMLHLCPQAVDMDAATDSLAPPWNPQLDSDPLAAAGIFFPSVVRPTSRGHVGAPTFASQKTGKALFEAAVAKLVHIVEAF